MKKVVACILCAFLMVSMLAVASAADDNIFEYNFEDDAEGDFIAIDGTLKTYQKNGFITVAKFDGSMCLKVDHPDGGGTSYDPYVNFLEGETDTYGASQQIVVEYDVYFESSCDGMSWQILCSRETPPAGTQFQQVGYVKGSDLSVYIEGEADPVANLEMKKWHRFAIAVDTQNDCFSVYLDGNCLAKDHDYTVADTSDDYSNLLRTAFQGWDAGSAVAYLDNVVIYNATEPREIKNATPVTTAAPTTEAPATDTAPATEPSTPSTDPSTATADIAVIFAAAAAVAASGAIVIKKKH